MKLISPFNGGTWVVPPDFPQDTLDYMLKAGFTRLEEPKVKPKFAKFTSKEQDDHERESPDGQREGAAGPHV